MGRVRILSAIALSTFVACVHDWDSVTLDGSARDGSVDVSSDVACATCPGGCFVLDNDPANCGTCGNVCVSPENAVARCSAGACDFTCDAGFDRCGDRCADTQTAVNFCGLACVDCAALPHVNQDTVNCSHGDCSLMNACATTYADCDGVASTGCEADLSSAATCGSCGNHCTGATSRCLADPTGHFVCSI